MRNLLLLETLLVIIASASSCEKAEEKEMHRSDTVCDVSSLSEKLNQNVVFFLELVKTYESDGEIVKYESGGGNTYSFSFNDGRTVSYNGLWGVERKDIPILSFKEEQGCYCWVINGEEAIGEDGKIIPLGDRLLRPQFRLENDQWEVTWDGRSWSKISPCLRKCKTPDISFSSKGDFLICDVNDSLQLIVPTYKLSKTLKRGVPNQGFYKDIFMDAGVYLTTRNSLAAATYLGYSLESVSCTKKIDTSWQNTVIAGSEEDENGRLLYPDGAPRYRMLFVCGGKATSHAKSLRNACREKMRFFVQNGGSYVGTCAGAFFVTSEREYYLNLWPGKAKQTGVSQTRTGMFIDKGTPLLNYYSYGGDYYVKDIRHNGGCYALDWPEGTELLARYDYAQNESMHGQPSAWAYKEDGSNGRIIMEGSHPEEVTSGERRDFTAAMLRYAADGVGDTKIKGLLRNGECRVMNKTTNENVPEYTRIGDMQYHHFAVYIPSNAKKIRFEISCSEDCDIQLTLSNQTYAYLPEASFVSSSVGANHIMKFESLPEGLWYVAVRCLTTVSVTDVTLGQEYFGRTDVLNGIPYNISVRWNTK